MSIISLLYCRFHDKYLVQAWLSDLWPSYLDKSVTARIVYNNWELLLLFTALWFHARFVGWGVCACVIWFNFNINVILVVFWWCLLVADTVLPHWNAILQALEIAPLVIFYCRQWVNQPHFLGLPFMLGAKQSTILTLSFQGMTVAIVK